MLRKIRIVLADDHAMVRKGFSLILSREPDMEIVAETGFGKEAVRLARERQVLQLLAEGQVAKEIATALDISIYTVDAHRGRIMKKLALRSLGELVKFAMRKGLVT